jgi:hypothetical protein
MFHVPFAAFAQVARRYHLVSFRILHANNALCIRYNALMYVYNEALYVYIEALQAYNETMYAYIEAL